MALAPGAPGDHGEGVLLASLGLLPLVAMLMALFAAVWIRDGERERAEARSRTGS